jgi:hypothetical protein
MGIVALVKDNLVLQGHNSEKQSKHFVPDVHLLGTFKFFSTEGNQGCSKQLHENLDMGKGSISNYVDHGVKAILSLCNQCFSWLSEQERLEISVRIKSHYFFKNCVKIIDGHTWGLVLDLRIAVRSTLQE